MIEVIAIVLIPCFSLAGFMLGCMLTKGEIWPTVAMRKEIISLKSQLYKVQDRYDHACGQYKKSRDLLAQYQKAYLAPPPEYGIIIQEEPDVLSLSQSG